MAIRGHVAEAALADLIQMLALGRRTGRLSVARDGELGTVYFTDGAVTQATLAHRRDPLGAALVRAGVLDDADLRAALAEQTLTPETPLGVLLVRRGAVPRATVLAQLTSQSAEAVYELLGWREGTFSFDVDVASATAELAVDLDVGGVLLEAARRADEAVLFATEVPGPSSTFVRVPPAGAADSADGPRLGDDEALGESEDAGVAAIASLLDAPRDVRTLEEHTGLSTHHVVRALYRLVRAGRVRRVAAGATEQATRSAAARADEHLNLGVAFARAGLLTDALRELRRALELRPSDAVTCAQLGAVALRTDRIDEAAAVLGQAAEAPGATADVLHALGLVRHRLGQLALADAAFARAGALGLENDPRHLTARCALALDLGEWAAAWEYADRARRHWTAPPAVWYHYAVLAAWGVEDLGRATALIEEGLRAYPRAPVLLANAAAHAVETGNESDATRALPRVTAALAERPTLASAQRVLGELQHRAGQFEAARAAYKAAVRLAPDASAMAWARLGSLALRAGDRREARAAWERACSLQPDHPTARANLRALTARESSEDGAAVVS